jgi:hypothetical protein
MNTTATALQQMLRDKNEHEVLDKFIDAIYNPCAFRSMLGSLNYNGYCALRELFIGVENIPFAIGDILDRAHDLYFDRYRPFKVVINATMNAVGECSGPTNTLAFYYNFPDGIQCLTRARVIEKIRHEKYTVKYFKSSTDSLSTYPIRASGNIDANGTTNHYKFDCLGDLEIVFGAYDKIVEVIVSKNYCDFAVVYL